MKNLAISLVLVGLAAGALAAAEQADPNSTVAQIRQAGEAGAVALYRKVMDEDKGNTAARSAFVRRMAELGNLGRAHDAARTLVFLDTENGIAWGVIAYHNALYGQLPAGLDAVLRAAERLENDAFVQRLAGQLLAWYDTAKKKPLLADAAERRLKLMRPILQRSATFQAAYDEVCAARLEGAAGPDGVRVERQASGSGEGGSKAGKAVSDAAGGFSRERAAADEEGFAAAKFRPLGADHFAGFKALARDARATATVQPPPAEKLRDADRGESPEQLGIVLQPFSRADAPAGGYAKDSRRPADDGAERPRTTARIEPYPFSGYLDPYYYAPYWPVYYGAGYPGGGYGGVGYRPVIGYVPRGTTFSVGGAASWGGNYVRLNVGAQNVPVRGR